MWAAAFGSFGESGCAAMAKLLEVRGLATEFTTQDGVVRAVDGISYDLNEGEIIGIVGESGCGKTVSALSIMRLVASPPGKIVGGEVIFDGQDLLKLSGAQMRRVRGNNISMIFQEPMTSLNPVLTVGRQLTETLQLHMGMNKPDSQKRARELARSGGNPGRGPPPRVLPPPAQRRNEPARDDRDGHKLQPKADLGRRADDGA